MPRYKAVPLPGQDAEFSKAVVDLSKALHRKRLAERALEHTSEELAKAEAALNACCAYVPVYDPLPSP